MSSVFTFNVIPLRFQELPCFYMESLMFHYDFQDEKPKHLKRDKYTPLLRHCRIRKFPQVLLFIGKYPLLDSSNNWLIIPKLQYFQYHHLQLQYHHLTCIKFGVIHSHTMSKSYCLSGPNHCQKADWNYPLILCIFFWSHRKRNKSGSFFHNLCTIINCKRQKGVRPYALLPGT